MITKLKRRFIALAMASLVALMTVIVAGMNIINYNTVIREADDKLAALSSNGGMLPFFDEESFGSEGMGIPWFFDEDEDDDDDYDDIDASTSEHGLDAFGRGRPFGSRDEAEETRFFSVLLTSDGSVLRSNTDRIFAVDDSSAGEYALEALKQGKKKGFVDEFRYTISSENLFTRITFLDCTSVLTSFRRFLYTSILMSLAGLAVIFGILCYFAGRIVKPVAESYEKQKRFITDAGHEIKTPLAIIKANIDVMRMDLEDIQAASSEAVVGIEDSAAVVGNDDPALSVKADADAATDQVMGSAAAADHIAESAAAAYVVPVNVESIRESSLSLAESLEDINGQVDRLASLTNDLVYLSRMEEAGSAITMTEIPVSDIVSETADSFSALALERKKSLDIQVTPMLSMQGSSKEIEKLVSILVENALKYSVEDDSVHISLKKEGKNIVLEVDNKAAEPLSDEDLAHVFDRFYRGDKSRNSASGGHGIGLSMASAIVSAHGGKIRARSGDGTEFIVTATMPAA